MDSPKFPREEGFRYFLHTLGRRYANPYPRGGDDHARFEAGWRQAALICGQAHLAQMALGEVAEDLPVVSRRNVDTARAPLVDASLRAVMPAAPPAAHASH